MEQVEHNEPVRGHPIGRAHTFFNINFINVVGLSHFLTSFKNKCKPQTNLKDFCKFASLPANLSQFVPALFSVSLSHVEMFVTDRKRGNY